MLLCIFNRYKLSRFSTSSFFYCLWHILKFEVSIMRWPTVSATVHLGVVYHSLFISPSFLSCMCFGAAKETSVNITVVFFCLSYSLLAICEISQKDTIFYRWQIPATWCMNFMFTRRLGNFVYVVKITHNKECQLSGPLARVLISNWHCKYTILFYGKQGKAWNFHANNILFVWI